MTVAGGAPPPRPTRRPARRRARRRFGATWLVTFAPLVLISVAWSLAMPLRAAPDESAHIVRAAAIVRGEWIGRSAGPYRSPAETSVRVPGTFVLGGHLCYVFKPAVPAGCQPPVRSSDAETATATYVGHYPPLFYLAVGWPSLLTSSTAAVYLMRVLGGVLCSGFVALAIASALRWSRSGCWRRRWRWRRPRRQRSSARRSTRAAWRSPLRFVRGPRRRSWSSIIRGTLLGAWWRWRRDR